MFHFSLFQVWATMKWCSRTYQGRLQAKPLVISKSRIIKHEHQLKLNSNAYQIILRGTVLDVEDETGSGVCVCECLNK